MADLTPPNSPRLERCLLAEVQTILQRRFEAFRASIYDFDDLVYLPAILPHQIPIKAHDFVFIDEAQDLSPMQLRLVLSAIKPTGRLLFVGDERQALYAFNGADIYSMRRIVEATQATILPLSVSYRCPLSHIQLAQQIAPEIQAAQGAISGEVYTITEGDLARYVRCGDMVICRSNALLIRACLNMISQGVPAQVKGLDIGATLSRLARLIFPPDLSDWEERLLDYADKEEARIRAHTLSDAEATRLIGIRRDLLDSLGVLTVTFTASGVRDIHELTSRIQLFFLDPVQQPVSFMTIHKAKGLEADNVFLLYPEKMPALFMRSEADARAEACAQFVALTRARKRLYFVEGT